MMKFRKGSVHAEIQVVQIMLLLSKRVSGLSDSAGNPNGDPNGNPNGNPNGEASSESDGGPNLPTVAELELRALGLRALALLPERWKASARPLTAAPSLMIESLLRCREIALVSDLLAAFPNLVDSLILQRYALAALVPPRAIDTLVDTAVISSYFEDSPVPNTPRSAPLHGGHRGDNPWLTGDPADDELLRAGFEIPGPPSVLLAKRYLRLLGNGKAISEGALGVCRQLLVQNGPPGGAREGSSAASKCAARQLTLYARSQTDADDDDLFAQCDRMLVDLDTLSELEDVAGLTDVALADLHIDGDSNAAGSKLARLCNELAGNDCMALVVKLAGGLSESVETDELTEAESCEWRWGMQALACGQYTPARARLSPLLIRAKAISEAAAPRHADSPTIPRTNPQQQSHNSSDDDEAAASGSGTDLVCLCVDEILQQLLVQPLSARDASFGMHAGAPQHRFAPEHGFVWDVPDDTEGPPLTISAAVFVSPERLAEAWHYLKVAGAPHAPTLGFLMHLRQMTPAVHRCLHHSVDSATFVSTVVTHALDYPPVDAGDGLQQLAQVLQRQLQQQVEGGSPDRQVYLRRFLDAACDFLVERRQYKGVVALASVAEDHARKASAYVSLFLDEGGSVEAAEALLEQAEGCYDVALADYTAYRSAVGEARAEPEVRLQDLKRSVALQRALCSSNLQQTGAGGGATSPRKGLAELRALTVLQVDARRAEAVAVQLAASGSWGFARRIALEMAPLLSASQHQTPDKNQSRRRSGQTQLDGGVIACKALTVLSAAVPPQPLELELLLDQLEEEHTNGTDGVHITQEHWNGAILDILRRKQATAPSGGLPKPAAEALVSRIRPPEFEDVKADGGVAEVSEATRVAGSVSRCEAWLMCRELGRSYAEAAKAADGVGREDTQRQEWLGPMRRVLAAARNIKDESVMELAEEFLLANASS